MRSGARHGSRRAALLVLACGLSRAAATAALMLASTTGATAAPTAGTASTIPARDARQPPAIAAASDLKFALEEIARGFTAETGYALRLVFGSSGNFFRQIVQGAPFELFLSADEELVFRLAQQGFAEDRGVRYALGRLVLFAPNGSPVRPADGVAALAAAAADGRLQRLAIANPEHAPYGRAAEQALRRAGAWEAVRAKLVFGENVSQAAQFAAGAAAQAGLFAQSLAIAPQVSAKGSFALVPDDLHAPLHQRMVLMKGAGDVARAFYRYLQQPDARAVLERHGFRRPDRAR